MDIKFCDLCLGVLHNYKFPKKEGNEEAYACSKCRHLYLCVDQVKPEMDCNCIDEELTECWSCTFESYGSFGMNSLQNDSEEGKQDEAAASMEFFENTLSDMIHDVCIDEADLIGWTEKILQGMRQQWTKAHSSILVNMLQKSYSKLSWNCTSNILIRRFLSTHDVVLLIKYNGELVFLLSVINFLLADTADKQISSLFGVHMVEDEDNNALRNDDMVGKPPLKLDDLIGEGFFIKNYQTYMEVLHILHEFSKSTAIVGLLKIPMIMTVLLDTSGWEPRTKEKLFDIAQVEQCHTYYSQNFLHCPSTNIDKMMKLLHQLKAILKNSQTFTIMAIYNESMTDLDVKQMKSLVETWKKVRSDHGANCSSFLDRFETKEKFLSNFEENHSLLTRIGINSLQTFAKTIIKSKDIPLKNLLEAQLLSAFKYMEDSSRLAEAKCNDRLASLCRKLPKYDLTLIPLAQEVKFIRPPQIQEYLYKVQIIQNFIQDDVTFVVCCLITLLRREHNPHPLCSWLQKMLSKTISYHCHSTLPNADEAIKDFFNASHELHDMVIEKFCSALPSEE